MKVIRDNLEMLRDRIRVKLCLTPPTEGFPWDYLRKILPACQQMAIVPNGVEKLPKISRSRLWVYVR